MTDLAAWLTQILDEQEKREMGRFRTRLDVHVASVSTHHGGLMVVRREHGGHEEYMPRDAYLAEFCEPAPDPQVLARIAADRQILDVHGVAWNAEVCTVCHHLTGDDLHADNDAWPCQTVRLLTSAHADCPGYQEVWKPE